MDKPHNHVLNIGIVAFVITLFTGCAATAPQPAETTPAEEEVVVQPMVEEEVPEEVVATPPPPPPVEKHRHYTVVRGDNLWDIAAKHSVYGNPNMWPLIFKANARQIRDADLIFPGQSLLVENNPSASDIEEAIQHAKNRGPWRIGPTEATDIAYLIRYGLR